MRVHQLEPQPADAEFSDFHLELPHAGKEWPPFLESIQIDGLRGWSGERIDFRFPVVAIAGENGAGKSAILKVAAAVYSSKAEESTFYPDPFFPNTPWGKVKGAALTYQIRQGRNLIQAKMTKATSRWRGMPNGRPVHYSFWISVARSKSILKLATERLPGMQTLRTRLRRSATKIASSWLESFTSPTRVAGWRSTRISRSVFLMQGMEPPQTFIRVRVRMQRSTWLIFSVRLKETL
ncbi:ATP-binding protein [Streptomyces xanthophaeus]|uniref:ATP-binding protein n=1 Tax=Streptomyces xanthophaeus TaxID=67385 RepID=UPI00343D2892